MDFVFQLVSLFIARLLLFHDFGEQGAVFFLRLETGFNEHPARLARVLLLSLEIALLFAELRNDLEEDNVKKGSPRGLTKYLARIQHGAGRRFRDGCGRRMDPKEHQRRNGQELDHVESGAGEKIDASHLRRSQVRLADAPAARCPRLPRP